VFARKGSEWGTANSVLDNPRFMEEAEEIRRAGSDGASSNAGKFRYPGA